MNDATTDTIAYATEAPQVVELIKEFQSCTPASGAGWDRSAVNDDVRFNNWPGKSPDGRKHATPGKEAFPFENASDASIYLADDICNELSAEENESFWRAWLLPKFGMTEETQFALKLADHFVNSVCYEQLSRDVMLSAQYRNHYGFVALQPMWVRELALEEKTITIADIIREAQARKGEAAEFLPALIADPTLLNQAAAVLQQLYEEMTGNLARQLKVETFRAPKLSRKRLKQCVEDLRSEAGTTTIPVPYLCRNEPAILPRKPWHQIFITSDLADLQQRRLYLRLFHDEVELKGKILTEGWSEAWVTEALKHKGKQSVWASPIAQEPPTTLAGRTMTPVTNDTSWQALDQKTGLVETVYAIYRALDADGVPGVYMTVFSPHFGKEPAADGTAQEGSYAWHGLLKGTRGRIPMIIGTRETVAANFTSSRGVPEIALSWQRQKKVQHDGLIDWTSVSVFPPLIQYANSYGTKFTFGPGVKNTVAMPGKDPRFMEIPGKGVPVSMEMVQELTREARDYFGLRTETFPDGHMSKKQTHIGSFLIMWTAAISELLCLAQANMEDAEFSRITGAPEGWLEQRRQQYGLLGARLQFDVRELNPEYALKQLDVMNKVVLPGDVTGAIPRDKWTQTQLRTVSPLWAKALQQDPQGASQKMFEQVRNDINSMFLGNEVQYVKDDPQAQIKLQFATQIVQANPNFIQALQQGEQSRFGMLMKKYVDNLQFSITQQQNAKVGAIGVNPESMQGQGMMGQ